MGIIAFKVDCGLVFTAQAEIEGSGHGKIPGGASWPGLC